MLPLELLSAGEAGREVANRLRALRLLRGWTQAEAAERSGMTMASYKRFERTGDIAFKSLLKVAIAFDAVQPFQALFAPPAFRSLDEAVRPLPQRQRAPRRRST